MSFCFKRAVPNPFDEWRRLVSYQALHVTAVACVARVTSPTTSLIDRLGSIVDASQRAYTVLDSSALLRGCSSICLIVATPAALCRAVEPSPLWFYDRADPESSVIKRTNRSLLRLRARCGSMHIA